MKARYKHISIPEALMDQVDEYLNEKNKLGFQSRAGVVKFCLRRFLQIHTSSKK